MSPRSFTRQRLRRTARVTLFAWVFALMSGVVNACLIQASGSGESHFGQSEGERDSGDAEGATSTDRQLEHARPLVDGDNHDLVDDDGKAGCLKFCTDESSALTKGKAPQSDIPGPILLASVHGPYAPPAAAVATWQLIERHDSVGPRLFLRLLRLTI